MNSGNYARNLIQIFRRITVIGDSLTAGYTSDGDVCVHSVQARGQKENWAVYLARRTGCEIDNIALGGTTSANWRTTYSEMAHYATDCYIVALGANDNRNGAEIGTVSDIKADYKENADTFYGNYDAFIRQLRTYNDAAHIFMLTMPSPEGKSYAGYNVAMRYIAGLYPEKVHLIDLEKDFDELYTDGVIAKHADHNHYTPIAYNIMSTIIEDGINDFMYVNSELFHMAPYK